MGTFDQEDHVGNPGQEDDTILDEAHTAFQDSHEEGNLVARHMVQGADWAGLGNRHKEKENAVEIYLAGSALVAD